MRRLKILAAKPGPAPQTLDMRGWICAEPLELEYLHTVLSPDHDVVLWDGMTDPGDPVRAARACGADAVLLTAFVTSVPQVLAWARALKALPQPPAVFLGGPHAEVCPRHFFHDGVDGVFFANALVGVREALARLADGRPFDDLPGAAFPGGTGGEGEGTHVPVVQALAGTGVPGERASAASASGWRVNPGPSLDPAALPVPVRVRFEAAPDRYRYLYFPRCASVKTAFGCPERCAFCFCTEQHGGRYGPRPVADVADEIAGIRGASTVFLLDDNFLTSPQRVRDFCVAVEARGLHRRLRFVCYGTADFVARNPDVVARFRDCGLAGLIVGFEFVADEHLAAMNKRARVADNEACLATCRDLDVEVFGLFVTDPAWTDVQFRRLADTVRRWRLAFATFSTLTTLPGTALARESGRPDDDVATAGWRYDLLRLHDEPRHLSRWGYYRWLFRLYLLPAGDPATSATLRRRYGRWGALRATVAAVGTGLQFVWRLWRWR